MHIKTEDEKSSSDQPSRNSKAPVSFLDDSWSWSSPSTWPLSVRFLPFPIAFIGLFLGVYLQHFLYHVTPMQACYRDFDYQLPIAKIEKLATDLATHDWEQGAAAEALLELHDPELSVFAQNPFPDNKIPSNGVLETKALKFVLPKIVLDSPTLSNNTWGVSDPASLGVFALLGAAGEMTASFYPSNRYAQAAQSQEAFLVTEALRFENSAISHRMDVAEVWSDAVFMFPPFMAYFALSSPIAILYHARLSTEQISLYRDVLLITEGENQGAWKHIVGPSEMADPGAWSTGNGWAAYGMARVRATLAGWEAGAKLLQGEIADLDKWIAEIVDAAIRTDDHESGLLRNYLGDDTWFGETAGTALIAAAAYRLATFLEPGEEREKYVGWAGKKKEAVCKHVDAEGVAKPAVNSLKHTQREPLDGPNPEGESFLLLLASAWRDCVCTGICER